MYFRAACFISPAGEIVEVGTSHIAKVIRTPEPFGLTMETIEKTYEKYSEPVGLEGQARKEILVKIIEKGWIRARRYREHWSVTVHGIFRQLYGVPKPDFCSFIFI